MLEIRIYRFTVVIYSGVNYCMQEYQWICTTASVSESLIFLYRLLEKLCLIKNCDWSAFIDVVVYRFCIIICPGWLLAKTT